MFGALSYAHTVKNWQVQKTGDGWVCRLSCEWLGARSHHPLKMFLLCVSHLGILCCLLMHHLAYSELQCGRSELGLQWCRPNVCESPGGSSVGQLPHGSCGKRLLLHLNEQMLSIFSPLARITSPLSPGVTSFFRDPSRKCWFWSNQSF